MTANVTIISATQASVALSGTATSNSVSDNTTVQIVLLPALFSTGFTAIGSSPLSLTVTFIDQPTVTYDTATFVESLANGGATSTILTATLVGDTFTQTSGSMAGKFIATNVPAGLTAVVTATSATTATVI